MRVALLEYHMFCDVLQVLCASAVMADTLLPSIECDVDDVLKMSDGEKISDGEAADPIQVMLRKRLKTGGGRSDGPYADSLPLSDHFQGGGGLGLGGRGAAKKRGGGRLHSLTNMA